MDVQDYYEILGVKRTATQLDIENAFERCKILYETDETQASRWKLIREAYQILSEPQHRRLYDAVLQQDAADQVESSPDETPESPSQEPTTYHKGWKHDKEEYETPDWLVKYRSLQDKSFEASTQKRPQRSTVTPKKPTPQIPDRVPAKPQAKTQSTSRQLEAPAGRYQPKQVNNPPRTNHKRYWGIRSKRGLMVAFIVAMIRIALRSSYDGNDNDFRVPTFIFATSDYSSIYRFSTPTRLRIPTRVSNSSRSNSGSSTGYSFNDYRTQTAVANFTSTPSSTPFPPDFTPSATPTATYTPTATLTNTALPPSDARQRCQITNRSGDRISIYAEPDVDGAVVASLKEDRSLLVYRENEDDAWVWIPNEQDHTLVKDSFNITDLDRIWDNYILVDDVRIDYCIKSH